MTMRLPPLAISALAIALPAVSPAVVARPAAAPAAVVLDRPERTLSEPFSFVRGVRELSNGKLLIADWIENRVVLADFGADACAEVITEGPGPQELRLPIGLVRHRADSTLLIDYGNNRVSVLDASGRAAYSIAADAPGVSGVRGLTRDGEFLFAIPGWAEQDRALPDDSVRIVRWNRGTDSRRDVAVVQGTRMRKDRSPAMTPRIPTVGYASQDAWVVTQSGAIAIVRATPYRIEVIGADGTRRAGPVVPVTRRPVTAADKRRYILEFSAGAMQSGRGENGGMGRAPAADEAMITQQLTTTEFALEHPPFDAGAVFIDMKDRVWVGRPAVPGQPRHYDVFELSGRRTLDVQLRASRRITHVGAHGVYVVAEDDDGVQTIERYRLP
jgi:hypothetical protein